LTKGVSTIIAAILLLIITISLIGTAYMFITDMLRRKITKTISIMDRPPCNATNYITLIIELIRLKKMILRYISVQNTKILLKNTFHLKKRT